MKLKTLLCLVSLFLINSLSGQKSSDTFRATAQFADQQNKVLSVHNINGSISIEGYKGSEVIIEVAQNYSARSQRLLSKAEKELSVKVIEKDNEVIVYLNSPQHHFDLEKKSYRSFNTNPYHPGYRYLFDFVIKVPEDVSVHASTVNKGELEINNVKAKEIKANNINGPISMENITGVVHANALNKDIDIIYAANPTGDCSYSSLNGDINIQVLPHLNADVDFKTLNGDMYIDLDSSKVHRKSVKEATTKKGVMFKLSKRQLTIGKGGPQLYFDLLNGDATITEKS